MTTVATALQEAQERRMTVRAGSITLHEGGKAAEVTTTPTDSELIAKARSGNEASMAELFARYETPVFRLANRILQCVDDADDVRQETFVRAFASLARYRQDASFKTYALTICSNLCRDRLRNKKRHPEVSYGLSPRENAMDSSIVNDPALVVQRNAEMARVRAALDRLPPAYREILHLRHVEELSVNEIAQIIGCTRIAAPVRLFRARKAFQELYLSLLKQENGE